LRAVGDEGAFSPLDITGQPDVAASDSAGQPIVPVIADGAVRVQMKTVEGDFDGDERITELDAVAALQMALGLLDEDLFLDVDGDGEVTVEDARAILQDAVHGG
jgi:hypothetical protein